MLQDRATRAATTPRSGPVRSLAEILKRLGPAVIEPACSDQELEVPVGDPIIFDPSDDAAAPAQSIVLAVGVDTEREQTALVRRLGRSGAAALVLRGPARATDMVTEVARQNAIVLLLTPAALSWGRLYTLLLTASASITSGAQVPLGDLFALANAIAAMVGGATTIEDPRNHVLAYSNLEHPVDDARRQTILGREVPRAWIEELERTGVFQALWRGDDVVRIPRIGEEHHARLAIAVRAGGEMLGSVWVLQGDRDHDETAVRALGEAADLAALHLLRHRSATDVDRRLRAETLLALLAGEDRDGRAASLLGLSEKSETTVVAFEVRFPPEVDESEVVVSAGRVADLVAVYAESFRRRATCAASGRRVYALLPTGGGGRADAGALARAVVDRGEQTLRLGVIAGIGPELPGTEGPVASRREADMVLDVLAGERASASIASLDDVRAQVVLGRLRGLVSDYPELMAGGLSSLADEDATRQTSWIPTLRAYFDAFGNVAGAAEALYVHPNTFRYRLRRISERFDLDLDDPDERLVTELQLRFLDGG